MAKNSYKSNTFKKTAKKKKERKPFKLKVFDRKFGLAFGFFLMIASFYLLTAQVSYLFTHHADQSVVENITETGIKASGMEVENWLGLVGAMLSHFFIFKWFGVASFLIPPFLFVAGYRILFQRQMISIYRGFKFTFFFTFWICLLLGYMILQSNDFKEWGFLSGGIGYELAVLFNSLIGWGTFLFLIFSIIVFVIYFFDINSWFKSSGNYASTKNSASPVNNSNQEGEQFAKEDIREPETWTIKDKKNDKQKPSSLTLAIEDEGRIIKEDDRERLPAGEKPALKPASENGLELKVEEEEKNEKEGVKFENYDPTLDLSSFKNPHLELLEEHDPGDVQVTKEELEQNKDKIVETLTNFKIGISSIKATIGPTVTLYEIIPDAGVKISKIKNLEDDIALNLAALGIRIIAPIPGKGTIGIEVPNKNREMVSIRSVLSTEKFMKSNMELPVVLGKTISNEVFLADLAKMPHLLMAGATGQGKSVGINVLISSLVYKKHPSQLKFVLVDPKKVELTLFNKLERHYLAKLPGNEEAIITDTKQVIYTLNSLCIEMDSRYDLLKDGGCRNLREYNKKFAERKLNPEKGHRFLPYIVLVIDELSDLMITAGKEIETPIIRLAQLARAIGIHIVIATQRPSVNVITGIIKANFPARISFRVTSKVDSRTILDIGGAEQLVGMGDMLLSMGSEMIRLQCPFVDTPEVEQVCDYIGQQRGYPDAYLLPEFYGEEADTTPGAVDLADRDSMFDDAARLIVAHQQGSTSLIQRKLKLGYNRAGRLIDQLEAAGIVGPFEGSKAREVLIQDEYSLEQLLSSLDENY